MTRIGPGKYMTIIADRIVEVFRQDSQWTLAVDGHQAGFGYFFRTRAEAVDAIPECVEAYLRLR